MTDSEFLDMVQETEGWPLTRAERRTVTAVRAAFESGKGRRRVRGGPTCACFDRLFTVRSLWPLWIQARLVLPGWRRCRSESRRGSMDWVPVDAVSELDGRRVEAARVWERWTAERGPGERERLLAVWRAEHG